MAKVSVIIPVYNRPYLVSEAIESVLNQSFTDSEIIIIDDGSTDKTFEVVQQYVKHHDNITALRQNHKGASAARNTGIENAQGEYISFLDSDDLYLPNSLEIMTSVLENNKLYAMAYSNYLMSIDGGEELRRWDFREHNLSGNIYPDLLFIRNNHIATPCVMVRKHVFHDTGYFDLEMRICEDIDLWRRIARKYKILQVDKELVIVRISTKNQPKIVENIRARMHLYRKAFGDDPNIDRSLRTDLFIEMYSLYRSKALNEKRYKLFVLLAYKAFIIGNSRLLILIDAVRSLFYHIRTLVYPSHNN